jgi:CHAT domain-containing protein/uncharacterized protein HemY
MIAMVLICGLIFVFWTGYAGLFVRGSEKESLSAESIEQLSLLIEKALKENDLQKLENIKISNRELVRGNLFLAAKKCSTLLDEGVKNGLSGDVEKEKLNFKIARVMAEIYQRAYDNSYLLDKVDLFSRWEKTEKEKYLEAKKFYTQGDDDYKKYSYKMADQAYNRSLTLYREIEYKAGEANILNKLGDLHLRLSEYEKARERYEQGLAIFREIKVRLGEANCLQSLGDIHMDLSEYEKARERYEQGLAIYREIKERLGEANILDSLGDVHYRLYEYEKAREKYEQGLALFREIKIRLGEANCLKSLGNVHLRLSEYDKARERYEQCLALFREIKARLSEANTLKSLGDLHYRLYEYEKAREKYEQGLTIYREIKARLGEAYTLRSLGNVHYQLDENEKAREKYEQGLTIFREIKDRLGEANCLKNLGDVYRSLSEYEKAREMYEQNLAIFREIKNRLGEANCLKSLGDVHLMLSDYEQARKKYEQSLAIFREIKARLGEANTLRSLGDVHCQLDEYEKAWQRYEQSLVIFREIDNKLGEANTLICLGNVHMCLYEYDKARENYEQGIVIYREIKARLGEANTLQLLGDVYVRLSEYEKAHKMYKQGLDIFCEISNKLGEAYMLICLGNVHMSLSEYEQAPKMYEQALAIFRKIKIRLGEAKSLQCLGDAQLEASEYEKAHHYYKEVLAIQKEIGDRYRMGQSYCGLGQTFEAMNNFSAAEKEYMNSIDIIEEVWEEMKREEFKTSYFTSNIFPYEKLICLLFKRGKGTQAFQYVERSKARSFLYLLGNKRIDIKKGVPLYLVRQEEELRQKITIIYRKILENEEKEPGRRSSTAQLNKELLQLKQTHSETLEKMKLLCPEYATLVSVNPLSTKDIQTLIRETGETVFLEYYTTPDAVYLWVLDGKNIFPYKININSETLAKKVQEYYTMISNPGIFGVETLEFQAQELYNLLLRDAENHWAGKNRIGIIPHGILHYLPFEALMNNGKFLVERDIAFFYLPSASVYKYCRDKNTLKKEQFISLGNPDGSLPFSEQEVKELKGLTNLEPRIFIGKEATETKARSEGPSADILHFSCHGVFNSVHPMYSALKLAADGKEDGNLDVQDIFQLELKPAYLVTLSACETHVGSIKSGDEIVVMSRAFIYAGTPSVLASLWKVDDYYTEKLMVSFYRALKTTDKITALHQARQEMIDKHGKRHPFYWAPFVLIGDFR